MARFFFSRRPGSDPQVNDRSKAVTALVRTTLALDDMDGVSVSEVACAHPDCGDAEIVILVMRAGRRTEAVKVLKSLALVTDAEIIDALGALGS